MTRCTVAPSALGNSASGHPQHLVGDSFDYYTTRYIVSNDIYFYYVTRLHRLRMSLNYSPVNSFNYYTTRYIVSNDIFLTMSRGCIDYACH